MKVIEATDVGVKFRKYRSRRRRLRAWLLRRDERRMSEFWALRHVTFSVEEGEVLGVIGPNGAGKSTLLRVIAGIYRPDEGSIAVRGRVSPLLALGAGFRPDLTGRDNVYLNGVLLGLSRREIDARFDEIVDFAELWDFIVREVCTRALWLERGQIYKIGNPHEVVESYLLEGKKASMVTEGAR